ncbi:MAG: hypothetical protein CME59_10535 [Halioglobus sp.]|nr:hypothetical protein [Halioglobus sp.]|tara:strand:+ start:2601 stop:6023 length:3423 start_codon:yes stop_codon:yes gene_type:complete
MKFSVMAGGLSALLIYPGSATLVLAAAIPDLGPQYRIPDANVSTSYGNTLEEVLSVWWQKYRIRWDVEPYGPLECSYYITEETSGVFDRLGRVRLEGDCHGSNPIYGTPSCPAGFDLQDDLCIENEEPMEDKEVPDECTSTGHPVNYSTGNKHLAETDIAPLGARAFGLSRSWNSFDRTWRFQYSQYLQVRETSLRVASVHRETGSVARFTDIDGVWTAQPGVQETLEEIDNQWLFTLPSGRREWFDDRGNLVRIERTDGRVLTLASAHSSRVIVKDEYGNRIGLVRDANGRPLRAYEVDTDRYNVRYAYNADGNLEFVSYPDSTPDTAGDNPFGEDNPYRQYHYESPVDADLLTGVTDENGVRHRTIEYDAEGRATSSGLGDGSLEGSTLDYSDLLDASDPRTRVTNALGKDTVYHFATVAGLRRVIAVEGLASANCLADTQSREYDTETGWLLSEVDRGGAQTTYAYYTDAARYGLLQQRTEAAGTARERVFQYDWDVHSRRLVEHTLLGEYRRGYDYDSAGRPLAITLTDLSSDSVPYGTNGRQRRWTFQYTFFDPDEMTKVESVTIDGPRTDVDDWTVSRFSQQGFLVEQVNALGHSVSYLLHNERGQPGRVIDANGVETRLYYTPRGMLERTEVENGASDVQTRFMRDAGNYLRTVVQADNSLEVYNYNAAGHLTGIINNVAEQMAFTLDKSGNPLLVEVLDADFNVVRDLQFAYDEKGRLLRETGSHGQVTGFGYDANGNLTSIATGPGQVFSRNYDELDHLAGLGYPDATSAIFSADPQGRFSRVEDQRGLATVYHQDGLGNLKQVASPDSGTTSYTYDAAGNRLGMIDGRGVETRYTYDALNRLTGVTYPTEPEKNISYLYDTSSGCSFCVGRLAEIIDSSGATGFAYDFAGRVIRRDQAVTLPGQSSVTLSTHFEYDSVGRLLRMVYPGGASVEYVRDSVGRVSDVYRRSGPSAAAEPMGSGVAYQPFGPANTLTYGNGLTLARTFDADGRLVRHTAGDRLDLSYTWDAAGNLWRIDNLASPGRSEQFSYDLLNRLMGASGLYGDIAYSYDAAGNRTSRTVVRNSGTTQESYSYAPDSNRLQSIDITRNGVPQQRGFSYDDNGNLVEERRADGSFLRPSYDASNRMDGVSP